MDISTTNKKSDEALCTSAERELQKTTVDVYVAMLLLLVLKWFGDMLLQMLQFFSQVPSRLFY